MANNQAVEGTFHGEKAIIISYGDYEAVALPDIGANLVAFRNATEGFRFLREPSADEMASFKARPMIHGIPVLFPPNRYKDGVFTFNGRTYHFPVNEEKTGNHLHGFLFNIPWDIVDYGADALESYVVLSHSIDAAHAAYSSFPHPFRITLRYALSSAGLSQRATIVNNGQEPMPIMLGFHTAVNAPFAPGSSNEDMSFTMSIGNRWELDNRMLPTGKQLPLTPHEQGMKTSGTSPFFEPMDNHYTATPRNGRHEMVLTDRRCNRRLVYEIDPLYTQWMIWNNQASGGFFCPEPQTSMVNAPNVDLPASTTGLHALQPGNTWSASTRMYDEEVQ